MGELEGIKGAWGYVEGGMGGVSRAIANCAEDHGASIFCDKVIIKALLFRRSVDSPFLEIFKTIPPSFHLFFHDNSTTFSSPHFRYTQPKERKKYLVYNSNVSFRAKCQDSTIPLQLVPLPLDPSGPPPSRRKLGCLWWKRDWARTAGDQTCYDVLSMRDCRL